MEGLAVSERRFTSSMAHSRRFATVLLLSIAAAIVLPAPRAAAQKIIEVRVESVKPQKTKHSTLRFLKENRNFIRQRLDLLRQSSRDVSQDASAIDPRFLAYQEMMQEIMSAMDSVSAAADAQRRMALLESIDDLASLESQLDLMDELLADQRDRLVVLQANFTEEQSTALMILISGFPRNIEVTEIAVRIEDGTTIFVPISAEQRLSLSQGGIAQIYHGFVEPRQQIIEVLCKGSAWPEGNSGFVKIDPRHDRLTLLKFDLSRLSPAGVGSSMRATTWLHDDMVPTNNR
jgi:hypothetical protein